MELERIIEILEKHQEWRRDQNVPPKTEMQSPIEIGTAIDYALSELKLLCIAEVSVSLLRKKAKEYAKFIYAEGYNDPMYHSDVMQTMSDFEAGFKAGYEKI